MRVGAADGVFMVGTLPNGDLIELPDGVSIGDVAAVDEPERGWAGVEPS